MGFQMNVIEFSRRVGVSPHTIRYYEKIGLLGDIQRLANGHRYFSEKDVKWIEFVQRLKDIGMPLEQIHWYAEMRAQGDSTISARQQLLYRHAQQLKKSIAAQQQHLNRLNDKIALYQSAIDEKKALTES